jgi:diguanylate cyclase (GGDEF)-like protein
MRAGSDVSSIDLSIGADWLNRFAGPGEPPPTVARELLADVLEGFRATGAAAANVPARLDESAASLGVLRAQQGRVPSGLVADVLELRPSIWNAVIQEVEEPAALLVAGQRLADLLDRVMKVAIDAFVQESQRVLAARAIFDQLTGLLNRAAFDDALERAVADGERHGPPALLLIDLDGFKGVNDSLGHLAGDDVLVHVAKLLTRQVRRSDVVARLGGDEFGIVLPRTSAQDARRRAERLVAAAEQEPGLRPQGAPAGVGLSVGVGWLPAAPDGDTLFATADEAMYDAKRAGGRRVAVRIELPS